MSYKGYKLLLILVVFSFSICGYGQNKDLNIDLGGGLYLELLEVTPGKFTMGSKKDDKGRQQFEWTAHEVTLTNGFCLSKYEITQAQYIAVMTQWSGEIPSAKYGDGPQFPAYFVSWYDALRFCNKLSVACGLEPVYTQQDTNSTDITAETKHLLTGNHVISNGYQIIWDKSKNGFRLPTEAEWEYAARAGTTTAFYWGDNNDLKYAWMSENSDTGEGWVFSTKKAHPVGKKMPNNWGFYDMAGNISEWCWDACSNDNFWGDLKETRSHLNPSDDTIDHSTRVVRGGHYESPWVECRSAARDMSVMQGRTVGLYVWSLTKHAMKKVGGDQNAFADPLLEEQLRVGPGVRNSYVGFRVARNVQ